MKDVENKNIIIEENEPLKILILGRPGVGKTSLKSIIFENKTAVDTFRLGSSNEIQETHLNFLSNIPIAILDCCCKDDYINQYFTAKKEKIFSNVGVLIFVVAISDKNNNKNESENELTYFEK